MNPCAKPLCRGRRRTTQWAKWQQKNPRNLSAADTVSFSRNAGLVFQSITRLFVTLCKEYYILSVPKFTANLYCIYLKWSGSFFSTITKVLDGISGITKNIIFFIWRLVRGETLIFVCFYGWIVCPAGAWAPAWRRPLRPFSLYKPVFNGQTTHRKKSKFLLSQTFKWKKIMFFVIPEMPSKTFVML